MQPSPKSPQRLEDRKAQKLMERIENKNSKKKPPPLNNVPAKLKGPHMLSDEKSSMPAAELAEDLIWPRTCAIANVRSAKMRIGTNPTI